jgi:AraC family transcriptional regulator
MLIPQRTALEQDTILRGRNHTYFYQYSAPGLSIKTMHNGQALYEIEGGRFLVDDDSFLILNAQQPYTIQIESLTVVDSFCIFFPEHWAEEVFRGVTLPADLLLRDPVPDQAIPVRFFERLYSQDEIIMPRMAALRHAITHEPVNSEWLEEQLRDLLMNMLHIQFNVYREIERMPAVRYATRVELYRRLHRARDYMHASLERPLTLTEIAGVAYLSPYHFLRAFKALFHETPHGYLTRKRLEKAQFLLANTDRPVTDICFEIGFESLGSFSTLFHRFAGVSPRQYRQQATPKPISQYSRSIV